MSILWDAVASHAAEGSGFLEADRPAQSVPADLQEDLIGGGRQEQLNSAS
jgi:hypothetical protein